MHEALQRNLFLVKEHVGMFKAASNYDVFDPETGEEILVCREERLGMLTKALRFTDYKRMTPFHLDIRSVSGEPILSVQRGISIIRSHVNVLDAEDQMIGSFRQRLLTIGGAFDILGPSGNSLCQLKGRWTSWSFKFLAEGQELAAVSKKWSGIGKELFTSADNYVLEISPDVPPNNPLRMLIIAAVFCVDLVLKE